MEHLYPESKARADAAIATMQAAALGAREAHARAELMRHMLLTAGKLKDKPRDAVKRQVVDEWLAAWALDRASFPHVGAMEALSLAFLDYVSAPSDAADRALRDAWAAVERAFAAAGMALADQMAWRSFCAHGWWAAVRPAPPGKGRPDTAWPERPFWEQGCPEKCR
jgi:hypothetical protein